MKDAKIEFLEQLISLAKIARKRYAPEDAIFVASMEIDFNKRLAELKGETAGHHHHRHQEAA